MQVNNLLTKHGGGNSTSGSKKQDLNNSRGYQTGNKMFGSLGLFHGGINNPGGPFTGSNEYLNIGTGGSTLEWGDLPVSNLYDGGGVTNGARAVEIGGQSHPGTGWGSGVDTIQWISIGKSGVGADFGEISGNSGDLGYTEDGSRGVAAYGPYPFGGTDRQMINIGTTSSAVDYGETTHNITYGGSGACDGSRAIFAGGHGPSGPNHSTQMEYHAIQTSATGADFGESTQATRAGVAHSDGSRGIHAGGDAPGHPGPTGYSDTIAYFNIGTVASAIDYGDMSVGGQHGGMCSNGSRGVVAGLWGSGGSETGTDTLDMINIGILGNAVDYGELDISRGYSGDVSGD